MACQNPITILSPESRWLRKCRKEHRSYEYYIAQANQRRNLQFDPAPLVSSPDEYYSFPTNFEYRVMTVPCGHCDLCLKSKVDAYFIRCYFEYLHTSIALRGSVYFITLTYANELLPMVKPSNHYEPVSCFSKRDVQLFLKRLRKVFSPLGISFKYFIVTEFGGEFGRPHYHGLLYFDHLESTDFNRFKVLEAVARSWTRIRDRKNWNAMCEYDMFDVQRVDVQLVDSSKQIRYVCKYVGKQFGAMDFDTFDLPQEHKRFHLQSIDFGSYIYDYCNRDVWEKGYIECDGYKYAIPSYYRLKLMREYFCEFENGSIVYRPTDFALQYMQNVCRRMIEEHKALSILNADYPRPPEWCFDPETLEYFYKFIDDYLVFRDFPPDRDVRDLWDSWNDYLLDVQLYNRASFNARAAKWISQQKDHYMKKTGRM